ncbi:MAG: hypothetical protein WC222_02830 [Parachlamydiales bacterium]|jgi:hypothetical protein
MIFFEAPQFVWNENPYFPEGTTDGNLVVLQEAEQPVGDSAAILWKKDFKLFDQFLKPLSDKEQFDEIEKELLNFCETIPEQYHSQTLGVLLFSGKLEDILNFPWDCQQNDNFKAWREYVDPAHDLNDYYLLHHYACKILNDFIEILTSGVSQRLEWFVQIDGSGFVDEVEFYHLANAARFENLHVFWKCPQPEILADLVWDAGIPLQGYCAESKLDLRYQNSIITGWCLPPAGMIGPQELQHQKSVVEALKKANISYRPIPDERIALNWQGLDTIIAISHHISPQGKRQLAGFCAAGGLVVTVGEPLGLPNEETFANFMNAYVTT